MESPEHIRKFSNLSLYQQLVLKCPNLALMIGAMCQPGKIKSLPSLLGEDGKKFINSVCMAASICLHVCNPLLSACNYRVNLPLLNGGAKAVTLERCAHLGISVSHSSAIRMQTKASSQGNTNLKVKTWHEDRTARTLQLCFLDEVPQNQSSNEVNLSLDAVQSYNSFNDDIYAECCYVLQKMVGEQSSVYFKRATITSAVQEIKGNIVNYK